MSHARVIHDFRVQVKIPKGTGTECPSAVEDCYLTAMAIWCLHQQEPEPYTSRVAMHLRRFTRLTNGFSKKLANLKAAVAVFVAWYNFCRVHQTLRVTPAMEAGLTDHVWTVRELLAA